VDAMVANLSALKRDAVGDLLHQMKSDELFSQKQGKDFVGENFLDNLVMETGNMMEVPTRGCGIQRQQFKRENYLSVKGNSIYCIFSIVDKQLRFNYGG